MATSAELLAPAGQPDAGYAALHYGADAVYLGLARFSARAEAVNFTPGDLAEFAAYAHSLTPRRQVYLTLNTLVKQSELADAARTLYDAADCGVDAVIVQDLGVAALARKHFPALRLHASTQMAVHNLEGALAARKLGYRRVTMARELTFDELRRIAAETDVEIEAFIHGTLCYSYSGLCLFSSMTTGRSGNRGRCVYTCREAADTPAGRVHPFSLKDMALGGRVLDLARAGVASLKIEGRKKSPLYVAATVDYYRRILDGKMGPEEARETEARLKTIFARPWTRLFADGRRNPTAADPEVVGHRGSLLGRIERVTRTPAGPGIVFTPAMPVERHDGLQVDLPGEARPYGFPVDNLYVVKGKYHESVFAAPAGQTLAVGLPPDAPDFAPGLSLYLSSSQAVKRSYPFDKPKPGAFGQRLAADMRVSVRRSGESGADAGSGRVECSASVTPPAFAGELSRFGLDGPVSAGFAATVAAFPARDAAGAEQAAAEAFARTGGSIFIPGAWTFDNPDQLYVRPGEWNRIRRDLLAALDRAYEERADRIRDALAVDAATAGDVLPGNAEGKPSGVASTVAISWSVAVDRAEDLALFTAEDFAAAKEVVIGIGGGSPGDIPDRIGRLAHLDREKIRLAIPLIFRDDPAGSTAELVSALCREGWRRWLVSGLGGWGLLSGVSGLDVAADWPLYAMNGLAAGRLCEMGCSSFTLSPEDDAGNVREMLAVFGDAATVVAYSDLPLFISAACAHAHIGLCRSAGSAAQPCASAEKGLPIRMERSGAVTVWPTSCGSIVTGAPYSLAGKIDALTAMGARRYRVDLRWQPRKTEDAVQIWRNFLSNKEINGICGNLDRTLL